MPKKKKGWNPKHWMWLYCNIPRPVKSEYLPGLDHSCVKGVWVETPDKVPPAKRK